MCPTICNIIKELRQTKFKVYSWGKLNVETQLTLTLYIPQKINLSRKSYAEIGIYLP